MCPYLPFVIQTGVARITRPAPCRRCVHIEFSAISQFALGHWIRIKNKVIENYQAIVPSTWNSSPRDKAGQRGPYEESLIGTRLADIDQPLEILRTIHSFDPCMACAVHVTDPERNEITRIQIV